MSILEDEIANDPLARGYSGMDDQQLTDSLNTVDREINRTSMSGREVMANVDNTEYIALSAAKKAQLLALASSDNLDPFGFAAKVVIDIFTSGATVDALIVARKETVSRGVELGLGKVRGGPVSRARP